VLLYAATSPSFEPRSSSQTIAVVQFVELTQQPSCPPFSSFGLTVSDSSTYVSDKAHCDDELYGWAFSMELSDCSVAVIATESTATTTGGRSPSIGAHRTQQQEENSSVAPGNHDKKTKRATGKAWTNSVPNAHSLCHPARRRSAIL
jgi:hypothetical protein